MNGAPMFFVVSALMALTLAGCKSNVQKDNTAAFYVESVKSGAPAVDAEDSLGFAKTRRFNLTACLQDNNLLEPIMNEPFEIRDEGGAVQHRSTERNGCFTWEEKHSFDYFAPETYFKVKRDIVGVGRYKGSQQIELAINPWIESADAVKYIRTDGVPAKLTELKTEPTAFSSRLEAKSRILDDVQRTRMELLSVSFSLDKNKMIDFKSTEITPQLGIIIAQQYSVEIKPNFRRRGLNDYVNITPATGKMHMKIVLMRDGSGRLDIGPDLYISEWEGDVKMQNGIINEDVTFPFSDFADLSKSMRAYVTVTPSGTFPGALPAQTTWIKFNPMGDSTADHARWLDDEEVSAFGAMNAQVAKNLELLKQKESSFDLMKSVSKLREITASEWNSTRVDDAAVAAIDFNKALSVLKKDLNEQEKLAFLKRLCVQIYSANDKVDTEVEADAAQAQIDAQAPRSPGKWFQDTFGGWRNKNKRAQAAGNADGSFSALQTCLLDPSKALEVSSRGVIESLNSTQSNPKRASRESIEVSGGISIVDSDALSAGNDIGRKSGYQLGGDASLNLSAGLGPLNPVPIPNADGALGLSPSIGVSVNPLSGNASWGKNWYKTYAVDKKTTGTSSSDTTSSRKFSIEAVEFEIDAQVRPCIVARKTLPIIGQDIKAATGVFYCSSQTVSKKTLEPYFFVTQPADDFVSIGSAWTELIPTRFCLRGKATYEAFKAVLTSKDKQLNFRMVSPDERLEISGGDDSKAISQGHCLTQGLPRMLTTPIKVN